MLSNNNEKPNFKWHIQLNTAEIKAASVDQNGNYTGVSVTSKSFDACRRSFHLKVDLYEEDVSLWLIERDKPVG